ncbi:MAG: hypothetical protein ACREMS_11370 [Gemmatimonadaceae bacterium]
MSRPVGVTASAIVAILGSIITLLLAVAVVASFFIAAPATRPPHTAQFALVGAAMFALLAGVGIWTAVGLFRLRSWARTSTLVFAGILAAWSILALLGTMAVPVTPQMSPLTLRSFRETMAVTFGIPLAIGMWWLLQFNTQSTKAAFASRAVESPSARPLSISIIGWFGILGGPSCLLLALVHMPAFFFGAAFTGWSAIAIYILFGVVSLSIGKGLLDLREPARLAAIGWLVFGFIHTSLITLVPAWRQRLFEVQRGLAPSQPQPIALNQSMILIVTVGGSAVVTAFAIWFLIRNRPAFVRADMTIGAKV